MSVCDIVGIGKIWNELGSRAKRVKLPKQRVSNIYTDDTASEYCAGSQGRLVIVHNIYFPSPPPLFFCVFVYKEFCLLVILRKSRSFFFHFSLRLCVSFVLFILTFPLYSPYLFCRIAFCVLFLFLLYGWSCSLETGPGSCLEREMEWKRTAAGDQDSGRLKRNMSYPLCRMWFTMIALADMHMVENGYM